MTMSEHEQRKRMESMLATVVIVEVVAVLVAMAACCSGNTHVVTATMVVSRWEVMLSVDVKLAYWCHHRPKRPRELAFL